MNSALTERWVNEIIGRRSFQKKLLAWDSCDSHFIDYVKRYLIQSGCEQVVVPDGCTKYIQVPDVVWKKPFKAKIVEYYEWLANGIHQYTAVGNLKYVPRRSGEVVKWMLASCKEL